MAKKIKTAASGGLPRPDVTVGPADPARARIARKSVGAGGFGSRNREAGMLIDTSQVSAPYSTGYKLEAYRSSYAYGLSDRTGAYDIPTYFVQMNEQNGGMLYWPVTLHEKYSWYRYWARCIYLNDNHLGQVLMADGTLKSVRDVQVGEDVVTGLGTIRKVKDKFERRCIEDNAVDLKVWCLQNSLKTTHHHPYWILRQNDVRYEGSRYKKDIQFNPEWVHAEDVKPGDYVLMAPYKPMKFSSLTKEQTSFLGYYVSEGSVVWGLRCVGTDGDDGEKKANGWKWHQEKVKVPTGVSFTLHKDEEQTVGKKIIELSQSVFGVEGKIVRRRDNHIEILVSGRNVGEFCHLHVGSGSLEKRLSKDLLDAPVDAKKSFLLAYAEGDGHQYEDAKNNGKILIVTASDSLASQVQMLAISAGVMCRIAKYERKNDEWSDHHFWQVIIPSWSADTTVAESSKWTESDSDGDKHCALFVGGYAAFRVKEVTFSQEDDTVYNIEVDAEGDEKSFICNGMVTHNTDAYIGRALELLSDLPMSKLTLNMPKMAEDKKELSEEILAFFTYQLEVINAFELCQNILWEMNMIGNVYIFHEWDDKKMMWSRAVMLPPEEVYVFQYPFTENKRVEYRPQRLISLIKAQGEGDSSSGTPKGDYDRSEMNEKIVEGVPHELQEMVRKEGCIVMDTDPSTGSFVHHVARRRSPYHDLGASVLERVLVPMLQKEHYRYTQLSLASRNMTPKNLITAPGLMPSELDELRTQVDLSYMDPEYSVITNYEVTWQQIGVQDRMLDFSREYEQIENQVFSALGVTRELLTGEGQFSGTKITVEILNTMFLLTREVLRNYIEKQLFIPICEAHGWFEEDKNGAKKYFYPQLGFNRLTIRDNAEVFDSLFQLYSKGSLPVEVIYELFNLNAEEMHNKLLAGMFTAKDSTFNRMTEEVNTEVGRSIVQQTDVVEKVSKYLGLKFKGPPDEGGGEAGGVQEGGGGDQEGGGVSPQTDDGTAPDNGQAEDNQESGGSDVDPDAVAKEVADALPPDASDKDIQEAIDEAGKAHGE